MRVEPRCLVCTLNRGLREIERSEAPLEYKNKAMAAMARQALDQYEKGVTPAEMGTARFEENRKWLDTDGGYDELKKVSTETALQILPEFKACLEDLSLKDRFLKAFQGAIAANGFDFDLMDHSFDVSKFENFFDDFRWGIDNRESIFKAIRNGKKIIYLLDNAGEAIFDGVLIEVIKEMDTEVLLGLKERRFLNDVTKEDAEKLNLLEKADGFITTDASFFGLDDGLEEIENSGLILAKGMGNYEVLDEKIDENIVFAFIAKCLPIANRLGVKLGDGIALLR